MTSTTPLLRIDINDSLASLLAFLGDRERTVITRRFDITGNGVETLEAIGRTFTITRERVRQIENSGLSKLRRTIGNTAFRELNDIACAMIADNGGAMLETDLISALIRTVEGATEVDGPVVRLALAADARLDHQKETHLHAAVWYTNGTVTEADARKLVAVAVKELTKLGELQPIAAFCEKILSSTGAGKQLGTGGLAAFLAADSQVKVVEGEVGLMSWRFLNPRNIRDKALIILAEKGEPMHFVELANAIADREFDAKRVTVQAVHNELIRSNQFVLIGRGLYALRDWGYAGGTVANVIEQVLRENAGPMTKKDLVAAVMKRHRVKVGTISLNLQKEAQFVRVGRAVYVLDETRKQPKGRRGAKRKAV